MPEIMLLPAHEYKDYPIHFAYDTTHYYDVRIRLDAPSGFGVDFVLTPFDQAQRKAFTANLYGDHWDRPEAHGIFDGGKLVAAVECCTEAWNNRLRVTNLWVDAPHRRKGFGKLLMDKAKETASQREHRAIVLETQSCNTKAIAFYRAQGFSFVGFDACHYTNEDIERKEVRIEMAMVTTLG